MTPSPSLERNLARGPQDRAPARHGVAVVGRLICTPPTASPRRPVRCRPPPLHRPDPRHQQVNHHQRAHVRQPADHEDGGVIAAGGVENPARGPLRDHPRDPAAAAPPPPHRGPPATRTIPAAIHMLPAAGARMVGTMSSAAISIAIFRARLTVHPRPISALEVHPPATDPTSATT